MSLLSSVNVKADVVAYSKSMTALDFAPFPRFLYLPVGASRQAPAQEAPAALCKSLRQG